MTNAKNIDIDYLLFDIKDIGNFHELYKAFKSTTLTSTAILKESDSDATESQISNLEIACVTNLTTLVDTNSLTVSTSKSFENKKSKLRKSSDIFSFDEIESDKIA